MKRSLCTHLIGPKISVWLLALYAAGYSALLLMFAGAFLSDLETTLVAMAFLLMAATPVLCLVHLHGDTTPIGLGRGRAAFVMCVMCIPAVFWLGVGLDGLMSGQLQPDVLWTTIGLFIVPGCLAAHLAATFGLLALRRAGGPQHG